MIINGIVFRNTIASMTMDHTIEAEIPLTGGESVITQITRESYRTEVRKYNLSDETADAFRALIDKYKITDWVGITPVPPRIMEGENCKIFNSLILKTDEGDHKITFREVPEAGPEASEEFKKLYFSCSQDDNKISEEYLYPSLKECREIKEEHGPVTAVETYHFSSGMMINSNQTTKQLIEKTGDGIVRVTVTKKAGNLPEASDSKDGIVSDIFDKIQEISDRENLPGWEYACIDPDIPVDRSMIPLDYSSSASLTVMYDDSLITGVPRARRTIGDSCCKMGGDKVDREISEMVRDVVGKADLKVDMPGQNLYDMCGGMPVTATAPDPVMGFMGMCMGMKMGGNDIPKTPAPADNDTVKADDKGPWDCKNCGQTGLTGKFCYNCGYPKS